MNELLGYLKAVAGFRPGPPSGWLYKCPEDFVLREGREYAPSPLPSNIKRGRKRECYRNAMVLAAMRSDLTYVEGYAISKGAGIPMLHAWCADADGHAIDPTWEDGIEYYGVPFSREFIMRTIGKLHYYGFIDAWRDRFPLLSGKWTNFRADAGHPARARGSRSPIVSGEQKEFDETKHSTSVSSGVQVPGGEECPKRA